MRILISAAEASSDQHAAHVLRELRRLLEERGEKCEAFGMGGPALRAAGMEILVDANRMLSMGFTEIVGRLPRIFLAWNRLVEAYRDRKPDLVLVLDYADFHFRLARKIRRQFQGARVVYLIPPKVWAWRSGRVRALRKLFDQVLCIFPFEASWLKERGVTAEYVGNPLLDALPLKSTREEARSKLEVGPSETVLAVMIGSRPAEVKHHLGPLLEACGRIGSERGEPVTVLMPLPGTAPRSRIEAQAKALCPQNVRLRVSQGDAGWCMLAADAGIIKSGTSTLEAGLLGLPHVVVYKTTASSEWIFKHVIRYRGPVGLVNVALGWKPGDETAVPEFICDDFQVRKIADAATSLLRDRPLRDRQIQAFRKLREGMMAGLEGIGPSELAARALLREGRSG